MESFDSSFRRPHGNVRTSRRGKKSGQHPARRDPAASKANRRVARRICHASHAQLLRLAPVVARAEAQGTAHDFSSLLSHPRRAACERRALWDNAPCTVGKPGDGDHHAGRKAGRLRNHHSAANRGQRNLSGPIDSPSPRLAISPWRAWNETLRLPRVHSTRRDPISEIAREVSSGRMTRRTQCNHRSYRPAFAGSFLTLSWRALSVGSPASGSFTARPVSAAL